ncbi:MAG: 2-oxoglutarate dehydrogenase E1 component [Holosporales bacterium]
MTSAHPLEQTLLNGGNAAYLSDLYSSYLTSPGSVPAEWGALFSELGGGALPQQAPSWGRKFAANSNDLDVGGFASPKTAAAKAGKDAKALPAASLDEARAMVVDSIRALMLIRAYRVRGHLAANLDPLGLTPRAPHPELDYRSYGFTESDLERPIYIDNVLGLNTPTLRQIVERLYATYAGPIGVEFMHIQDPAAKAWIQERFENQHYTQAVTKADKKTVLENVIKAEYFEKFLQLKYTGTKRFGLEGGDVTIAALEEMLRVSAAAGVQEAYFGMAHRGRLNVLSNIIGKPFTAIFSEFQGTPANPEDVQGSGDVKYHMGTSRDRDISGRSVHLSLTANPSHLEAVNPVVAGKVRAKQDRLKDAERRRVMAVIIHGDAAFAGQGVVAETFMLSDLDGYKTGGTYHLVINNQIGFTTNPRNSRSSPYCSDVARMVQAPIFHVNGDNPDAVVFVARLAAEFRAEFGRDVVVDIICYRRHGHNESDEPAFTQPQMYKAIGAHPTLSTLYIKQLVAEGTLSQGECDAAVAGYNAQLDEAFIASKNYKPNKADWLEGAWTGLEAASGDDRKGRTGVSLDLLKQVGERLCFVPEGFDLNPKIRRQLEAKAAMFKTGEGIDWGTGEALAFGTLLAEGSGVRLSGQDSGRGTFSHRHAELTDQTGEAKYVPLSNLWPEQGRFEVLNSPLSEFAVMGFDYGYSLAEPGTLTLWEGQFGDFVNGAQVMIDQFIASAETKWLRMSGIVLLLPHGYEGQGPEHSSARPERFLQLCAEDNWQVANCSTPAQYFHILRRQLRRNFRKPLILMTPKSLLRHKLCVSKLEEFGANTTFHRVLPETGADIVADGKVKRVVLCSGKVYYDLLEARIAQGIKDVALVRLEQFYPFPKQSLVDQLSRYKNAEVVWCQEEPQNQGAWHFLDRRLEDVLQASGHKGKRPVFVGRADAAAPATGLYKKHNEEQARLVAEALKV